MKKLVVAAFAATVAFAVAAPAFAEEGRHEEGRTVKKVIMHRDRDHDRDRHRGWREGRHEGDRHHGKVVIIKHGHGKTVIRKRGEG